MSYKAKFCAQCGQRDSDGKVTMKNLLGKLWNNTIHLEGKFLLTAWQLFVPGLVTKEFFKGKQDRYPHPIRLFGIVMFFFVLLLNQQLNNNDGQTSNLNFSFDLGKTDSIPKSKEERNDYESKNDFRRIQHRVTLEDIRKNYAALPPTLQTPLTRQAVDSLLMLHSRQHGLGESLSSKEQKEDTIDLSIIGHAVRISALDIVRYEPEELLQRMAITNWLERMFARQAIKSFKNPEALGHAYIGSFTWTILAIITFMASILTLLYRRRQRYYVEHFIFLLHFHTGALLLLTLSIVLLQLDLIGANIFANLALIIWIAMFFGLWRYYDQGFGKTLFKWLIFSILYIFSMAIFFVIGLLVVFAFY